MTWTVLSGVPSVRQISNRSEARARVGEEVQPRADGLFEVPDLATVGQTGNRTGTAEGSVAGPELGSGAHVIEDEEQGRADDREPSGRVECVSALDQEGGFAALVEAPQVLVDGGEGPAPGVRDLGRPPLPGQRVDLPGAGRGAVAPPEGAAVGAAPHEAEDASGEVEAPRGDVNVRDHDVVRKETHRTFRRPIGDPQVSDREAGRPRYRGRGPPEEAVAGDPEGHRSTGRSAGRGVRQQARAARGAVGDPDLRPDAVLVGDEEGPVAGLDPAARIGAPGGVGAGHEVRQPVGRQGLSLRTSHGQEVEEEERQAEPSSSTMHETISEKGPSGPSTFN